VLAQTEKELSMTSPWQLARRQWSQPTSDIHALRRARGRAAYNARRQRWAGERRRMLCGLLREAGFDPAGDLRGAGTEALYRRYAWETGRSRATFYRDLALLKAAGRFGSGGGGVRGGSGRRDGAGTWDTWEWEPGAPGPSPSPSPSMCEAGLASPSVRPRDITAITDAGTGGGGSGAVHAPGFGRGAGPAAAGAGPSPRRAVAWEDPLPRLLAALRREPCPTCGRLPGLPARTEVPGPYVRAYVALRLALEQQLSPEVVETLLVHAARLQAELRPPRRVGESPRPSPPAARGRRPPLPALTRPERWGGPGDAPGFRGAGTDPDQPEVFVWRI
jgi:hypothetical protein